MSEMIKCGYRGCTFEHALARSVGVHRRVKHGIMGKSVNALKRYEAKKLAKKEIKAASMQKRIYRNKIKKQSENTPHVEQSHVEETTVIYAIGRIYQIISDIAAKSNYTTEHLANRCAKYLATQKVWE